MSGTGETRFSTSSAEVATVGLFLGIHVGLVAYLAVHQSPNIDETAHLAAGVALWQYGSHDLYCVNPPLMRAVAAVPVMLMPHNRLWGDFDGVSGPRPEFVLGNQFVESHPDRWRWFLTAGRWALLPFTVLGGLFCWLWARELFGVPTGLLALVLWCFSPNILTWSSIICTDGLATSVGIGAGWVFWRWLRQPTWRRTVIAGIFLGLAVLSKFTWLLLFVLWPLLWLFWRIGTFRIAGCCHPRGSQMLAILLTGIYVLNLAYGFSGTLTRLSKFEFHSELFSGKTPPAEGSQETGNRFSESVLGALPIPLPTSVVRGIDLQKLDFEQGMPSYLFGKWSDRGWWYYYLVGLGLKVPLGTVGLGLLAAFFSRTGETQRCSDGRSAASNEPQGLRCSGQFVLLLHAGALLAVVSSQDGFSRHFRYAVPVLPFVYVWVSRLTTIRTRRSTALQAVVGLLLGWSVVGGLSAFPHTMSYFNLLGGGARHGHWLMLGSSFSWSQDHFRLKQWLDEHPEADSPYMLIERSVSLERLGLRSRGRPPACPDSQERSSESGPVPGWHVISVQNLHARHGGYRYFLDLEPHAIVGSSIYIYRLDRSDANRLRASMGFPLLKQPALRPAEFIDRLVRARDSSDPVRVAVFAAGQAGQSAAEKIRSALSMDGNLSWSVLSEHDIRNGLLSGHDVVIVPGGRAEVQGTALGAGGREHLRRFVDSGGGYVGICAGARLAAVNHEWSLKLVNAHTVSGQRFVPGTGMVSASFRGWGPVHVEHTTAGRALFSGSPERIEMDHTGGPVFFRSTERHLPDYIVLSCFRSELWKYAFQKGGMKGTPAILAASFGHGRVVLFSAHPETREQSRGLLRDAVRAAAGGKQ